MTEGIKRQMWHVPMDRGCVSAPGSRKHPRSRSEKSEPQNGWYYFPREVHVTAPRSPEVDADIMGPGRSFPIPEDRRIHAEQLVPSEQDIAAGNRSGRDGSGKCALPSKEPCNQYRNQLGNRQKHRLEYATGSPEAESDKLPFEKLAVGVDERADHAHAAFCERYSSAVASMSSAVTLPSVAAIILCASSTRGKRSPRYSLPMVCGLSPIRVANSWIVSPVSAR